MNYRIEEKDNMKFVGIKRNFSTVNGENFKNIPLFWDEIMKDGTWQKMTEIWGPLGTVGICGDMDLSGERFDYYIAVEENEKSKGTFADAIETGRQTWAVFECVGPLPGAIQNTFRKIYEEWLPSAAYEHEQAPELEVYLPGDPQSDDYRSEVWIPVRKK